MTLGYFILFICYTISNSNAEIFNQSELQEVDDLISKAIECNSIPGLSLAIFKDGLKLVKTYGLADISTGRKVDEDTVFCIASLTKAFTSMLLAIILSDEKLNHHGYTFNTPIQSILGPEYRFIDDYRTTQTTLEDILAHRTGLMAGDIALISGYPLSVSRDELCKRLRYLPESKPFRDEYLYNNFMYMLAARVAELLGGASWEYLVTQKIFRPLGMNITTFLSDVNEEILARPYLYNMNEGQIKNIDIDIFKNSMFQDAPAGAICSTSADMLKWMEVLLNRGYMEGQQLVNQRALLTMMNGHISLGELGYASQQQKPFSKISKWAISYGFGWNLGSYRGYRRVYHSGSYFGQSSALQLFPDMNFGVYITTNGPAPMVEYEAIEYINTNIIDMLLQKKRWLNQTRCRSARRKRTAGRFYKPGFNDDQSLEINATKCIGSFGNYLFGDVHISIGSLKNQLNFSFGINLKGILVRNDEKYQLQMTGDLGMYMSSYSLICQFTEPDSNDIFNIFYMTTGRETYVFHRNISFNDTEKQKSMGNLGDINHSINTIVLLFFPFVLTQIKFC